MKKQDADKVKEMQADYKQKVLIKKELRPDLKEAYFDRRELIEFLGTVQTQYAKIALVLAPMNLKSEGSKPHQTMAVLGVSAQGEVQNLSQGLISDLPCPPICKAKSSQPNV